MESEVLKGLFLQLLQSLPLSIHIRLQINDDFFESKGNPFLETLSQIQALEILLQFAVDFDGLASVGEEEDYQAQEDYHSNQMGPDVQELIVLLE